MVNKDSTRVAGDGRLLLVAVVAAIGLTACGGGSDGGSGSDEPVTARIFSAQDPTRSTGTIYTRGGGAPVPGGGCPSNISLNTTLVFEFESAVDINSVPGFAGWSPGDPDPASVTAIGSIQIFADPGTAGGGASNITPASGTFRVEDIPTLPAGNRRRVVFRPDAPASPTDPAASSGIIGGLEYTVVLPSSAGGSNQTLRFGGRPLTEPVLSCFRTCDPTAGAGPLQCFTDVLPGPPIIVRTEPATSATPGNAIDPAAIMNNTISVFFSEPLFPTNTSTDFVRLINTRSGAQVPGRVEFFQAGTPEAGPVGSRIDYILTGLLPADAEYSIVIESAIRDFGDNSVRNFVQSDPPAFDPTSPQRLLTTMPVPFCRAPTDFGGDFPQNDPSNSSNRNLASLEGVFRIQPAATNPNSEIISLFPFDLVGDGAAGALSFAGLQTIDTAAAPSPGMSNGNINASSLTVSVGTIVRVTGEDFPVHIRSLGPVAINGLLNASGGDLVANRTARVAYPDPNATGLNGALNSDVTVPPVILGGSPGAGGGRGGNSSTSATNARAERSTGFAESGWGPARNGIRGDPSILGSNPDVAAAFAGGQGGESGHGLLSTPRDVGGFGGAGASHYGSGSNGGPHATSPVAATCPTEAPLPTTLPRMRAVAPPLPATATIPPTVLTGGSGGGAGGDAWNFMGAGATMNVNDAQGGGGGGGGGGFRISSIGPITVSPTGSIRADGGLGGLRSNFFAGEGAGGAGGLIWLQCFDDITISSSANVSAGGGTRGATNFCNNSTGGNGGGGLIMLEDQDGNISTSFLPPAIGGGRVSPEMRETATFPFSSNLNGTATSIWFDTGYGDPNYPAPPTERFSIGDAPGATVTIEYQGAFEAITGGVPDLGNLSPWVAASTFSAGRTDPIDGYRFIRYRVVASFDPPMPGGGGTGPGNTLPTVQEVSIPYETPIACTTPN